MYISPINYNLDINKYKKKPNFKSVARIYADPTNVHSQTYINTLSMMFRDDVNWIELAKIIHTTFKNQDKVNNYCLACSDGSEAYTHAISLIETSENKDTNKFFPIIAADKDTEVIHAAQSGRINLSSVDINKINKFTSGYTNYFIDPVSPLSIQNDLFQIEKDFSFKPTTILKDKIVFIQGDILNILKSIEDKGNTVVLCRNVAPFLSKNYQQELISTIEKSLRKRSLFVIGKIDTITGIRGYIGEYMNSSKHFKQIEKYIYQKI